MGHVSAHRNREEFYEYRGPASEPSYTLIRVWDDEKAEHIYFLTELNTYPTGEVIKARQLFGDKDWAKRIAARYGLKLPKTEATE